MEELLAAFRAFAKSRVNNNGERQEGNGSDKIEKSHTSENVSADGHFLTPLTTNRLKIQEPNISTNPDNITFDSILSSPKKEGTAIEAKST